MVATYRALLDPATASTETTTFSMVTGVREVDPRTVRFDLAFRYSAFPHRLTLGVLPSEALAEPGPAETSALTTEPIGTGPYRVSEWRKSEWLVLDAHESYWGGVPQIRRITIFFATDYNTRAQRMTAGEFDGTVLPPGLAHTFDGRDGYSVISHRSADPDGRRTGHRVPLRRPGGRPYRDRPGVPAAAAGRRPAQYAAPGGGRTTARHRSVRAGICRCSRTCRTVGPDSGLARPGPHEVSDGQLQRACLARALVLAPRYLLCDEMTAMVDASTTAALVSVVRDEVAQRGLGVLAISHDEELLGVWADRLVSL